MRKKIERMRARQAIKKKAGTPSIEWKPSKINNRHGNIFANSTASKEFKRMHRGVFSKARKLIQDKFKYLERGGIAVDKKCQVAVEKAFTGKFPGTKNILTMKVTVEGKELFVKIAKPRLIKANVSGLAKANEFLQKKGYRFGKFNVRAILPFKAVTFKNVSYLATDFLREGEVTQVYKAKNSKEIEKCIKALDKELSKIGVVDAIPANAFFHKKTNTILLFDLTKTP